MMKRIFLAFSLTVLAVAGAAAQTRLRVATFNLRYDNKSDTGNLWVDRAPVIVNLIRFHDFDIFGTQEGLKNQLDDISAGLTEYDRYGLGRDDGKDAGEHSAIFYRKNRFKLLGSGDFWLSQTPDKPSLGWDAKCCNRICSWVYLQEVKSKKKFFAFNAHFDHQGVVARVESARLILAKINEIAAGEPVIFTGDLNGDHESEWYKTLASSTTLRDTWTMTDHPYANNTSFNAFGKEVSGQAIIDHIFVSAQFTASKWGILTDTYHGKYPSDHFPVMADIALR